MARVQVDDFDRAVAVADPGLTAIAVPVVVAHPDVTGVCNAHEVIRRAVLVLASVRDDDHAVGTTAVPGVGVRAGAALTARPGAQPGEHGIASADKSIILRVEDINARIVAIRQNVGAPT